MPKSPLADLHTQLTALETQSEHSAAQLDIAKQDAQAAFEQRDTERLSVLLKRMTMLEAQQADYADSTAQVVAAIRAAVEPRRLAILQAAETQHAEWGRVRDEAEAEAAAAVDSLEHAIAQLRSLPTWDRYGAILRGWRQQLTSLATEAGVSLASPPEWPEPVVTHIVLLGGLKERLERYTGLKADWAPGLVRK